MVHCVYAFVLTLPSQLSADLMSRPVAVDSPQIACHAAEAEVGDRNVCVRCDVKAKPVPTTIFWIVADNGSSVLAGQVTDHYWVVIKVLPIAAVNNNNNTSNKNNNNHHHHHRHHHHHLMIWLSRK